MADDFSSRIAQHLEDWQKAIEEIEEQAQSVDTFDKLELLARAERLRTKSREIERNLELLEEVDEDGRVDEIRKEIENIEQEVGKMLAEARDETRKRIGGD